MDFGDYAQVNELESVMTHDHEYRRKQSQKGKKWREDDIHLTNVYLVRKTGPRPQTNRPSRQVDTTGQEVHWTGSV